MLENEADSAEAEGTENANGSTEESGTGTTRQRRRAASRPAGPPPEIDDSPPVTAAPPVAPPAASEVDETAEDEEEADEAAENEPEDAAEPKKATRPRTPRTASRATRPAMAPDPELERAAESAPESDSSADEGSTRTASGATKPSSAPEPELEGAAAAADSSADEKAPRSRSTRSASRASRPAMAPDPELERVAESAPESDSSTDEKASRARSTRTASRATKPATAPDPELESAAAAADSSADEKTSRSRSTRSASRAGRAAVAPDSGLEGAGESGSEKPARTRARRRSAADAPVAAERPVTPDTAVAGPPQVPGVPVVPDMGPGGTATPEAEPASGGVPGVTFQPPMVVFQPPQPAETPTRPKDEPAQAAEDEEPDDTAQADHDEDDESGDRPSRRRRRRGGRGRGRGGRDGDEDAADETEAEEARDGKDRDKAEKAEKPEKKGKRGRVDAKDSGKDTAEDKQRKKDAKSDEDAAETGDAADEGEEGGEQAVGSRRRRRRRRRTGAGDGESGTTDDPPNTVVHVRDARAVEDEVQAVRGSTRLEAKKQRRREGREQGRRRPPVITEAEFLARRESVERQMVVRQEGERTQIAVLEDGVLVEHYVNRATHQSYVGNVYLGKVQNVLPSMEAAFVDVGKGRNAVLYAGEVNWDVAGLEGQPRRIESALKSGQSVLVQVTKDPVGHKGARLTSQISLPGRYLVYVPDGSMTGISRKLPDKERSRLKQILKRVMPENAGVIVRTAAEGATEEELARDVSRLAAQWTNIQKQVKSASAPSLLYGEPDLTIRVVRDIFNEDFSKLVVAGPDAWDTVSEYVEYVAPHLADRVERWTDDQDVLSAYRIDEQIAKALDRKVWLPSGGSLVIDRTEAMTVIDVNTGKFTGQGGNLEETVTRNNLEAAEEIVRQLRLRDIGGIVVIDFIDMVLESNRDLVLRRLVECLSRDRTKHQVAEVTSLGLVQMTRKRVGQGLLEAFSETCESCNGRGIHVHLTPVEPKADKGAGAGAASGGGRRRKRKGEVEKAVEEKLSQQEGKAKSAKRVAAEQPSDRVEQPVGDPSGAEADDREPEPQAAVEAAQAAAETAEAGPGPLEAVEPVANGVEPAEPVPGEGQDEVAAAGNGRRRRTRRPRAKALSAEPSSAAGDPAGE
ncbi:hypothetical protein GCM10010191_77620 [Actinomadura vinacea]|uniref:S1 motif domain-containing protein n=1 Tax=Actinomadura vinacea TaxID=115336 RepID=A0ABN3K4F3_9ACTN